MKTKCFLMFVISISAAQPVFSQIQPSAAVMTTAFNMKDDRNTLGLLLNLELEKTHLFTMMDPYEAGIVLNRSSIHADSCYGKGCAIEAGKALKVDKMITGRFENFGKKVAITLKIIDVSSGVMEQSITEEFINLEDAIDKMTAIAVANLTGKKADKRNEELLGFYEQPVKNPDTQTDLSGPRFGAYITTGDAGRFMRAPEEAGGFEMGNIATTFGWQAEKQYLSSGNFSALVEVIMLVSGLESGRFIPSVTLMNGFRTGNGGWELAFGPVARVINMSHGKINSDGTPGISTGFVIAGGKTFRSGYLNLPVNIYTIPRKHGWVVGLSMGFNIYKTKTPHSS